MIEELEELSRRLVGLRGWRWRAGMLTACGVRLIEGDSDYIIGHRSGPTDRGGGWIDTVDVRGFLPDLSDPATIGCLLALVRDAWDDPYLCCVGDQETGWRLDGYAAVEDIHSYRSEAEALFVALKSAPRME